MNRVFFDNAATTPLHPEVKAVMVDAMDKYFGNPSSIHMEGRTARSAIEAARKTIANALGASIGEIFFTSGGTESNNMALKCAVRDLGVKRFITTHLEHHCVLNTLVSLQKTHEVEVVYLQVTANGTPDLDHLRELLQNSDVKTLVALMHANNEIGTMIDLDEVATLCQEQGAFFHSDTVQTVGYYPIDVSTTSINFLTGSGHKLHGPKGIGFIYINGDNMIKPLIDGGSQERNMRAGTENIYGVLGIAKAVELAAQNMEQKRTHIEAVRTRLMDGLQANFPAVQFVGDPVAQGHYKILSTVFPDTSKSDLLQLNLDIAGISVSGGSACSSGADVGSHVLEALQTYKNQKMIRFSFSQFNTVEEVDYVLERLKGILG